MKKIGLVEDELDLQNIIKLYLEKNNYEVVCFTKGSDAISYKERIDLWILDIMLEDDISGYDVIKAIRKENEEVPVIFTSARDQEIDKILGLELGSDDYLTKPYSPKELVLRVDKIMKRVYKKTSKDFIYYEDYSINIEKRIVKIKDEEIKLTTLEFDLLVLLINNMNKSFAREDMLDLIWGNDYFGTDRVVDDLVRRLRKKMPILKIDAIYGYGYRLI